MIDEKIPEFYEDQYLIDAKMEKFKEEHHKQWVAVLLPPPTDVKMSPTLRRSVDELRYFAKMNRAVKTHFWRARYGIPERLYNAAPRLPPQLDLEVALVFMREADSVGELRILEGRTKQEKKALREFHGLDTLSATQKRKIARAARAEWSVNFPEGRNEHEGPEYWKPDINSSLVYSPANNINHNIVPWRSVGIDGLLDPDIKFSTLANCLIEVVYACAGLSLEKTDFLNIPMATLLALDYDKKQVDYWISTTARRRPVHRTFYSTHELIDLQANNPERFHELMARLAIVLHEAAHHIKFRVQYTTLRIKHNFAASNRVYRLFVWKRFADAFSVSPMLAHHYIFFASFHPYFTPSDTFVRDDKARYYLTRDELTALCSHIEMKREPLLLSQNKTKRVYNEEAKTITTVKVPNPEPRKGYFIGRAKSTILSGESLPAQEKYAAWLRLNFLPNLRSKAGLGEDYIEPALPPPISQEEARQHEAFFYELCEFVKPYAGESQLDYRRFKSWLYDRDAPGKPYAGQIITLARFASLGFDAQELLAMSYFGYKNTLVFEDKAPSYVHNIKKANESMST